MRSDFVRLFVMAFLVVAMTGCAAVGVPATFNPHAKLKHAEYLFNEADRPLPAEPLIIEALQIYQKRGDEVGLANAYRTYAFFLQSPSVGQLNRFIFSDKAITLKNRFEKSAEYWKKAIRLYDRNDIYNLVADSYFQMEKLYYIAFKDVAMACFYNDKSRESIIEFRKKNPDVKLDAMGFGSFEEMIDMARSELGCE